MCLNDSGSRVSHNPAHEGQHPRTTNFAETGQRRGSKGSCPTGSEEIYRWRFLRPMGRERRRDTVYGNLRTNCRSSPRE